MRNQSRDNDFQRYSNRRNAVAISLGCCRAREGQIRPLGEAPARAHVTYKLHMRARIAALRGINVIGFLSEPGNSRESSRNNRGYSRWRAYRHHHPRSRIQLTLSVLRMDRVFTARQRVAWSVGRLFSGLANWFPATRLDYANRICVLAFD